MNRKHKFEGLEDLKNAVRMLPGIETPLEAVLALSVFPPRKLVEDPRIGGRAIVNAVRAGSLPKIGKVRRNEMISPDDVSLAFGVDGGTHGVLADDNTCPHLALTEAYEVGRDMGTTTVCHVFGSVVSQNPRYFTSLPNLVLVPFWLAKLTDTDPDVKHGLRWAVRIAYKFCPHCGGSGRCGECSRPSEAPRESWVLDKVDQWADRARDGDAYLEYLRKVRTKRWRRAMAACAGYSYTVDWGN